MTGPWREGQHDDLVLALAVAAWHGDRHQPPDARKAPLVYGTPPWWAQPRWY